MPIIKSAKKRMKQTAVRRSRNQNTKRSLRAEMKALAAAIEKKDGKKALDALKKVQSNLDKSVKKNVLKKNTAARKLARLSDQVKALGAKPTSSKAKKPTASAKSKATPAKKAAPKTAKPAAKAPAKKPAAKKTAAKK